MKMEKIVKFGHIEIQKQQLHQHKRPVSNNIYIASNKASNEVSFGKKKIEIFQWLKQC